MDQHANQIDPRSIAGLYYPQLPPHPHLQLPPHPHPQLPPHPLLQPAWTRLYHPVMYQNIHQHMAPVLAPTAYGIAIYPPPFPTNFGHSLPPPRPYDGYIPGPQAMCVAPSSSSAPSTVQSQMQVHDQQLEQGPLEDIIVGADEENSVQQAQHRRIFHHKYRDFERVDRSGEVVYKCPLLHCQMEILGASIRKHLTSNKHLNRRGRFPCPHCDKKLSREGSVKRHLEYCAEALAHANTITQGPGAAPATVVQPTVASTPSAAPVTVDEDDNTVSSKSSEDDYNTLESDAVPGHLDDTEDSVSGDKLMEIFLHNLDWDFTSHL